jgi:hypothetical protein
VNAHRLAEERSIALHREIAHVLRHDPVRLKEARDRVRDWLADGSVHPRYAQEWAELIDGPFESLLEFLVDPSEHARALRQSTPFAGYVDPRRRWQIWDEVRRRLERAG